MCSKALSKSTHDIFCCSFFAYTKKKKKKQKPLGKQIYLTTSAAFEASGTDKFPVDKAVIPLGQVILQQNLESFHNHAAFPVNFLQKTIQTAPDLISF